MHPVSAFMDDSLSRKIDNLYHSYDIRKVKHWERNKSKILKSNLQREKFWRSVPHSLAAEEKIHISNAVVIQFNYRRRY